jgi:hypothetical protein
MFQRNTVKSVSAPIDKKSVEAGSDIPKDELEILGGVVEQLKALGEVLQQQGATEETSATLRVVKNAERIISDAGMRFKRASGLNPIEKASVLSDFVNHKDKYIGDMVTMAQGFKQIEVTAETVDAWRKLAAWLDALHECTASRLRKDGEGKEVKIRREVDQSFPHLDTKDLLFKKATKGTSKYTLVRNYGKASKNALGQVAAFESKKVEENQSASSPGLGN